MGKERIQLSDSMMDIVMKMSEGNPGAVSVLAQLLKENGRIDPDSALAEIGTILHLDTAGIYGSKIWMVYKDICGEDITSMIGLLRGAQLGYISDRDINKALDQPYASLGAGVLEDVLAKVRERLPAFAK